MLTMPNATCRRILLLTLVSLVGLASPALAQFEVLKGRFAVHANGGYQSGRDTVRRTFSFRAYGEDARFEERHETKGSGLFDVGGSLRVWEELRVGASFSQLTKSDSTRLTGSVPNPIAVNAPRILSSCPCVMSSARPICMWRGWFRSSTNWTWRSLAARPSST